MILGAAFIIFVLIPVACVASWKLNRWIRISLTPISILLLVVICFIFGQAVGRAKAWHHWRQNYQLPLFELQGYFQDLNGTNRCKSLEAFADRFAEEKVDAYGLEPWLTQSEFSRFVTSVTEDKRHPRQ
jgi:hypothetical protein